MTDDLVERLRYDAKAWSDKICDEAADRIEQLEAALCWYADVCGSKLMIYQHIMGPSGDYGERAVAALAGEKKDAND